MVGQFPHTATYWAVGSLNKFGELSYGSPNTFSCHYQDKVNLIVSDDGQELVSNSVLYVDGEPSVGKDDYVYLGTSIESSPPKDNGAYRVLSVKKTYSVDGTQVLGAIYL